MAGGAKRGGLSESVCRMVFTLLLEVQLLGILSILGILSLAIFFSGGYLEIFHILCLEGR